MTGTRPPSGPPPVSWPAATPPGGPPPPPTPPSATAALVLGVLSLLCFGFLTGIPAMLLGRSAQREVRASQGRLGGDGVATAGFVTGLLGTVLSLLAVLGLVLLLGALGLTLGATFGEVGDPRPLPSGPCGPGADPSATGCAP